MSIQYPEGFEDLDFGEFRDELLNKIAENRTVDLRLSELRCLVDRIVGQYTAKERSAQAAK